MELFHVETPRENDSFPDQEEGISQEIPESNEKTTTLEKIKTTISKKPRAVIIAGIGVLLVMVTGVFAIGAVSKKEKDHQYKSQQVTKPQQNQATRSAVEKEETPQATPPAETPKTQKEPEKPASTSNKTEKRTSLEGPLGEYNGNARAAPFTWQEIEVGSEVSSSISTNNLKLNGEYAEGFKFFAGVGVTYEIYTSDQTPERGIYFDVYKEDGNPVIEGGKTSKSFYCVDSAYYYLVVRLAGEGFGNYSVGVNTIEAENLSITAINNITGEEHAVGDFSTTKIPTKDVTVFLNFDRSVTDVGNNEYEYDGKKYNIRVCYYEGDDDGASWYLSRCDQQVPSSELNIEQITPYKVKITSPGGWNWNYIYFDFFSTDKTSKPLNGSFFVWEG